MTLQTSSSQQNRDLDPKAKMIRMMRFMGAAVILFAVALRFNLGGLADLIGLDAQTSEILITALLIIGLMDIFLIPRILQMIKPK